MAQHDGVDAGADGLAERPQLHAVEPRAVGVQGGELQMGIGRSVAVSGIMLHRRQQAARVRALHESRGHAAHQLRVLAVRAHVDDRVGGVGVDVRHRREGPVHAERAAFAGGHLAREARVRLRARGPHRHGRGQRDHAPADAEVHAALHVGGDDQRHVGRGLERVELQGKRRHLGFEDHHASDLLWPARLSNQKHFA